MNSIRTHITPATRERRIKDVMRDIDVTLMGGDVLVTVEQFESKGSSAQNRLFHDLCDHCAVWWNNRYPQMQTSAETIKGDIKSEYGLIVSEYSPVTGTRGVRLESWSRYGKKRRADLIAATLAWMAEKGIPDLPQREAEQWQIEEARRAEARRA